jgi:hypothetical protein
MILAVLFANVEGNILIERYALKIGIVLARSILLNFCFIVFFNRSSSLGFYIYIYIYIYVCMYVCVCVYIYIYLIRWNLNGFMSYLFNFRTRVYIFFFSRWCDFLCLFLCALFCVVVKWEIVNDWDHLVLGEYLCCLWRE